MSSPKKHHFVPRSYLEGFTESESQFLNVYSKRNGLWRRQKANQVMVRNKYYSQSWVPEGVDENVLEKSLGGDLEPKGLNSIKRMIHSQEDLTDDDTANLIAYIEFQRIRVPRQIDEAKRLAQVALEAMVRNIPEGNEVLKTHKLTIKDEFRFEFLKIIGGRFGPYLGRMMWEIVRAEDDSCFITSDSPVSLWNEDFIPPLEPGIGLYGTILFFPLDSRHLLILRHPEYMREEKGASERLSKDLDYQDGYIELRRGKIWGKKAVEKINWIMYQLAQDTIVGCSKESLEPPRVSWRQFGLSSSRPLFIVCE